MGICDVCARFPGIPSTLQLRSLLRILLVMLLVPLLAEAGSPYHLEGIPKTKPDKAGNGSKRIVSTATNSPIYYINKLDLSSLFFNLLPPHSQQQPQLNNLTSFLVDLGQLSGGGAKPPKAANATKSDQFPFKRIPLPFVSNAKPVGSYKLKQSRPPLTTAVTTTTRPWYLPGSPATLAPSWITPSSIPKYTPSKIIRLKTKFLSNGQPSAVYVFKSPLRRYSLQDILRRRMTQPQDKTQAKRRPSYKTKERGPFW